MKKPLIFSEEKKSAVDVSRSCVVSAGAGSGKTVVLVARYLRLLVNGVEPKRIVAMTFTNKAAAELRHRIDEVISYSLRSRNFEERVLTEVEWQRLFTARQQLSDGHIGTIHAFCHRLLREEPTLLPRRPFAGELDQTMMRQFRQEAERSAASAAEQGGALDQLLDAGVWRSNLRKVSQRLLGKPDELAAAREGYEKGFDYYKEQLNDLAERILIEFREVLAEAWWGQFNAQLADPVICEHFNEKDVLDRIRHLHREMLPFMTGDWDEPLGELLRLSKLYPLNYKGLTASKGLLNGLNPLKGFKDLLKKFIPQKVLSLRDEERAFRLSGVLLDWVGEVAERYLLSKERATVVDFNDQISSVAVGVTENADFRKRLRGRYRHFLIDEFQDTDPRQWEIIRRLAEPAEDEANTGGRTLFIVGDRKQAIYGFRGGDNTVFNEARRWIRDKCGGDSTILMENWRSRDGVLDFVNPFFDKLFSADMEVEYAHPTAVEPQPMLRSRPAGEDGSTLLVKLEGKHNDTPQQALATAEVLAALLNGELEGIEPPENRQRWIGVLTRTHNQINLLTAALEYLGLGDRFSLGKGKGLFQRKEVGWLRATLKALYDGRDPVALAAALLSPFGGFDYNDLLAANEEGNWSRRVFDDNWRADRFANFRQRWRRWKRLASLASVERLVRAIYRDSGIEAALRSQGQSERWEVLTHLMEPLRGLDPIAALSWLEESGEDGELEAPAPGQNEIVLMTIHSAKGLEFPLVLLPFLGSPPGNQKDGLGVGRFSEEEFLPYIGIRETESPWEDGSSLVSLIIRQHEGERSFLESKRLLYVAATRARDHLLLVYPYGQKQGGEGLDFLSNGNPRFASWLDSLLTVDEDKLYVDGGLAGKYLEWERRAVEDSLALPTPAAEEPDHSLLPAVEVYDPLPLAPSSLGMLRRCPVEFYLNRVLRVDTFALKELESGESTEGGYGAVFGSALHYLAESGGGYPLTEDEVSRHLTGFLDKDNLPPDAVPGLVKHLRLLDEMPIWRKAREAGVRFEIGLRAELAGCLFMGRIDAVAEIDGEPYIFDFKTTIAEDGDFTALSRKMGYDLQLTAYALGWEARYGKRPAGLYLLYTSGAGEVVRISQDETEGEVRQMLEQAASLARRPFAELLAEEKGNCPACKLRGLCNSL